MHSMTLFTALAFTMCLATSTFAASTTNSTNMMTSNTGHTDIKAALDSCAASVAKDKQGGPDRTAMDACMTAKGIAKPPGHGGPGGNGNHEGIPPSDHDGGMRGPPPGENDSGTGGPEIR